MHLRVSASLREEKIKKKNFPGTFSLTEHFS
jgi:hypothetical protein